MFRFQESDILWFLFTIPILLLVVFFHAQWKKKKLSAAGNSGTLKRLFPFYDNKIYYLKNILILTCLALLTIAWANPQWGQTKQKVKAKSSDVFVALDISQSMMAEDITPNRMERAKFFVTELIKRLKGDRVGLIFFAGNAYLQMPLTQDYASAQTLIRSANPAQAGTQGTVIADAINLAQVSFQKDVGHAKAIIVISDGENHETQAITAAKEAAATGTRIFTLGIGTAKGAEVPVIQNNKKFLKKDKQGRPIVSALNQDNLINIADAGDGKYYQIDQTLSALNQIDDEIEKLEKRIVEQRAFKDFNSYFQYFLGIAILILIVDLFISYNRKKALAHEVA